MSIPSVERLKELLHYCPETGSITWAKKRFGVKVGAEAGTWHKGYRRIKIDGKLLLSHRVAFAIFHGKWPDDEVDHINRVKSDNRISNLRHASRSGNMINRTYPVGESGVTGVSRHKCGWQASIRIKGKSVHLGLFKTIRDASIARSAAELVVYGEFLPKVNCDE